MQRRAFLGNVLLAGVPALGGETGGGGAFNRSGLHPEEYKREWVRRVRAGMGKPAWIFQPSGAIVPFMAWYPGDEWVDVWALDSRHVGRGEVMGRSFAAEAGRRGKRLLRIG
ncbi:MAG: hypothetical protein HY858_15970 [Candidatus Solibacter usitatus]|nr:hypothetical protein [Candidatus Solibacter usitatus]